MKKIKDVEPGKRYKSVQRFVKAKDAELTVKTIRNDYQEFGMKVFSVLTSHPDGTSDIDVYEVVDKQGDSSDGK